MVRFDKLGDDISKNPQFSKFGQARAAYLAALIGLCAGAGLMLAVFGSRELMLFGLFLVAQVRRTAVFLLLLCFAFDLVLVRLSVCYSLLFLVFRSAFCCRESCASR